MISVLAAKQLLENHGYTFQEYQEAMVEPVIEVSLKTLQPCVNKEKLYAFLGL